jgi:hypothetical protein
MIDGIVMIAIDVDGNKSFCKSKEFYDVRLEDLEMYDIEDQLTPNDLKDCLVAVFFKYTSVCTSGGWWGGDEYEDCFDIVNHVVIQNNYKEFWREQISIEITSHGYREYPWVDEPKEFSMNIMDDKEWAEEIIEEWETLYDEDFTVHPKWAKKDNKEE